MKIQDLLEVQHNFTRAQLEQIEHLLADKLGDTGGGFPVLRDVKRNVNSYSAVVALNGKRRIIEFSCKIVGKNVEDFKLIR